VRTVVFIGVDYYRNVDKSESKNEAISIML